MLCAGSIFNVVCILLTKSLVYNSPLLLVVCIVCSLITCFNAVQKGHSDYDEEDDLLDVFDITEAEPDLLFVNPFGCQVDPLCWRELQVSPAGCEQYLQAN